MLIDLSDDITLMGGARPPVMVPGQLLGGNPGFVNIGLMPFDAELLLMGGSGGMSGDLVEYLFGSSIVEQVNEQAELVTLRNSNSNPTQLDGSVTTVGENTAALVVGGGDLIQDGDTNPILQSSDISNASWTKRGTGTAVLTLEPAPVSGTFYSECFINQQGVNDIFQAVGGAYGNDAPLSLSFRLKKVTTTGVIRFSHSAGSGFGSWEVDLSLIVDGARLTKNSAAVNEINTWVANAAGNGGVILAPKIIGTDITFKIASVNLVEGNEVSSEIESTNLAGVRDTDGSSISAYLDKGVLIQSGVLGDLTSASFVNGVSVSLERMSFAATTVSGTFVGVVAADFVGGIVSSNGFRLRISVFVNGNIFEYEKLDGITDAQITANFSHSNILSFDFSRSLYAPDDVQGVIDLMGTATPPVTGLSDNTVQWPVNDFILSMDVTYKDELGSFPRFLDSTFDGDNAFFIRKQITNKKRVDIVNKVSTVLNITSIFFTNDIEFNDKLEISVTKDSTNGTTLTVNNVTAGETQTVTNATQTQDVTWGSTANIGNVASTVAPITGIYENFLVEPL